MSMNPDNPFSAGAVPPVVPPGKPDLTLPTEDERTWALVAHLSPIVVGFIGPLVVWLIKTDESAFLNDQGKEALNFQIAVMIAALVCGATCVGAILIPFVGIGALIYAILGGIEANKGVLYRYPYTIRLIN
jgi:uncharacterized protein